ncbi:hypothetical protein ONZ43_g3641 [Nemania bipapillata]|uniref:Uncharacterized protein n=1 Tax=Nemania bipapillata TaxID=110536 RepID=A0ACC2IWA9_9PEZI|nr:hypothetical protein ONZ43_g3641 [Nemania bipapillata]
MKFMQRAAAASPSSSAPSTPPSNDQSSKRRKIAHGATPEQNVDTLVDQSAIRAAIAEEEKKVESALLKRAEELGDARWVLDVPEYAKGRTAQPPLNIVQVGFAQIDSSNDVENEAGSAGTLHDSVPAFRRYNMDKKKFRLLRGNTWATVVRLQFTNRVYGTIHGSKDPEKQKKRRATQGHAICREAEETGGQVE